jgi:hypothetical protein
MANFTTRIELFEKAGDPKKPDYQALHAAMKKEGFTQTVEWGEGVTLHLPHAEYNRVSDLTTAQIRDLAVKAASTVWTNFCVLVTKADGGREQHNLKKE